MGLTDKELNAAIGFYRKHPYRISVRILISPKGKWGTYRETEEFFKTEAKAKKHYENLVRLHSPEWEIDLGLYRGLYWHILDSTRAVHHVWRFDEHGIESGIFNLDNVRERVTA